MAKAGTALITGASEGIGYELSKLFAKDGYDLGVVARNEAKLRQISEDLSRSNGISARVIVKDLSHKDAPDEIYDELSSDGIKVDILVNNAGYAIYGPFEKTDISQEYDMLQVLVWAPTKLTKLFMKEMLKENGGKILNVSSYGAFAPTPLFSVYGAAKSYILLFSEAVAEELSGSGVTITALCPGATRTQFARRAGVENIAGFRYGAMSAESAAKVGYQALMEGKKCVVPGVHNRLLVFSRRLMPVGLAMKVVKAILKESRDSR